jgi:hypothetical protein
MSLDSFATIKDFRNIMTNLESDEDYIEMKCKVILNHLNQVKNKDNQEGWSKFNECLDEYCSCYSGNYVESVRHGSKCRLKSSFTELLDDETFRVNIAEIRQQLCGY